MSILKNTDRRIHLRRGKRWALLFVAPVFLMLIWLVTRPGFPAVPPHSSEAFPVTTQTPKATATIQYSVDPAERLLVQTSPSCTIRVLVVSRHYQCPVSGVPVSVIVADTPHSQTRQQDSLGDPDFCRITDSRGYAVYALPPSTEVTFVAAFPPHHGADEVRLSIITPSAGDTVDIVMRASAGDSTLFCGRAIDSSTGLAVLDATITTESLNGGVARAASQIVGELGQFDLTCMPDASGRATISAPGYVPIAFRIDAYHATSRDALILRMSRVASLTVQLRNDLNARLPDVLAQATTPIPASGTPTSLAGGPPEQHTWIPTKASDSKYEFLSLPPETLVDIVLVTGRERSRSTSIILSAGEHRSLTISLADVARVFGVATDQNGQPIVSHEIWLVKPSLRHGHYLREGDDIRKRAVTNEDGAYELESVVPGEWLIGVAPARPEWAPIDLSEVAPEAKRVTVAPGQSELQVDLLAARGLYVSGKVVAPDGSAVTTPLYAYISDGSRRTCGVRTDDHGVFALGPLAPGRCQVVASGQALGFCDAGPTFADPGGEPILLVLRDGGTMTGYVWQSRTGRRMRALLNVLWRDPDSGGTSQMYTESSQDGFTVGGLREGEYAIIANTDDGLSGLVAGIRVVQGIVTRDIRVDVEPVARLRVCFADETSDCAVEVRFQGLLVARGSIDRNRCCDFNLCAGEYEVLLRDSRSDRVSTQTCHCTGGAENQVRFP